MISILMSTYNEPEEYIRKSVESILAQTITDFEFIIMVDNPKNEEIINLLNSYCHIDNRVRMFINEKNFGLARSLNHGLQYCKGLYIARMDADDIAEKNRLEKQKQYLEENDLDMISCFLKTINYNELIEHPIKHEECINRLKYHSCLPHPGWFGKREVFLKCDGYRDIYACEDYDFLIRAVNNGYRIGNCKECLVNYRINPNSISRTAEAQQRLATQFISKKFRQNREFSIQEYQNYINTSQYENKKKKLIDLLERKKEYKNCNEIYQKIRLFLKVVVSPSYWEIKIYDWKIKRS